MAAKQKDLQEPDELLATLQSTYKYVMENIKLVSVIAGGILAGLVIIVLVLYQIKMSRIREAALLNQAVAAYHEGQSEEALAALEGFSGKGGVNGVMAELYRGNILYDQGRYDEALKHFETARDQSTGEKLATLKGLALQGIAYAEMALEQFDRAEEALQGIGAPFEDLSQLELGRLYLLKGEKNKATRVLEELTQDFPDSPWLSAAEKLQ
jgi:predicted negative regulator of RcsB-dependent stress response